MPNRDLKNETDFVVNKNNGILNVLTKINELNLLIKKQF